MIGSTNDGRTNDGRTNDSAPKRSCSDRQNSIIVTKTVSNITFSSII